MDLLITGGTVITMDPSRRVIPNGAVAIRGQLIEAVGSAAELPTEAAQIIDATGHAVLPGLIDGHAHAGHGLVKTLGGGDSAAWSEACRVIYTTASPPSFWHAEARLAALERLMFGVTTGLSLLGGGDSVMRTDTPAHGDAHCRGVAEIGIRDIMAVGPTRPPHPRRYASWEDGARNEYPVSFEQQFETIGSLIERWHGAEEGRLSVATLMPVYREDSHDQALVALVERQGRAVIELGRRHGTLFHQDGHRSGSLEMAGRMFGLLGADALMSHCTDLTEADIEAVVATDTRIVHNPSAIASVRGYCPVPALLDRGVAVILGSDGTAPDRSTDMFRHMFQCMRLHQRQHRDERLMPPGKLLEMVTIDAARALHMEDRIGSIEPGKRADVITVDLRKPHTTPVNMPVWRVVCFANGQDVDTVVVDGRVLMRGRSVGHVDVGEVLASAEAETAQMLERTGFGPMLAEPAAIWGRSRH
jgi:cytosine/adenosine deaminase-related metal-dependent hydrolase